MIRKVYLMFIILFVQINLSVYAQEDFLKVESEVVCDNCTESRLRIVSYQVCMKKDSLISLLEKKIDKRLVKVTDKNDRELYKKVIDNAITDIKSLRTKSLKNQRLLEGNMSGLEYSCNLLYIYWSNRIIENYLERLTPYKKNLSFPIFEMGGKALHLEEIELNTQKKTSTIIVDFGLTAF